MYVPGEVERCIHDYLKEHISHGEWFYPTVLATKLADLIAAGDAKGLITELGLYRLLPASDAERSNFDHRMNVGDRSIL